jgi:hypothetical protein
MGRQTGSNAVDELRQHWQQWAHVVELFAKRRRARRRVDEHAYTEIHQELLGACRSISEMVEAEERAYFEKLEHLALPWVSPKSFLLADRQLLGDLLIQCRQIERDLGGRAWRLPDAGAPMRLVFMATALLAGLMLLDSAGHAWLPIFKEGRSWSQAIQMLLEHTRYVHYLLTPALIVVIVSS